MCRVCWETPGREARGTFDNHGQINDTASLQPSHTALFIYIIIIPIQSKTTFHVGVFYCVGLQRQAYLNIIFY